MGVQVHVTAWPQARTVTVGVTGEFDARSAAAVAALLVRLSTELVTTLIVDLAEARLPDGVPRALIAAMQPVRPAQGARRRALVNAPRDIARPTACTAPQLLWHERDPDALAWEDALRRAQPAAPTGACDCDPADPEPQCATCREGCTGSHAADARADPGVAPSVLPSRL